WQIAFDSTDWAIVSSLAGAPDGGAIVGGSFAGTLRASARVVSTAGGSDGFVARVSPSGEVAWLVRLGGAGADAVQGVAAAGGRGQRARCRARRLDRADRARRGRRLHRVADAGRRKARRGRDRRR